MSDIEQIMQQYQPVGKETPQAQALREAVASKIIHRSNQPTNEPTPWKPQVVAALLDARNAIDAALAYIQKED